MPHVIRARDRPATAWKNGGGTTRAIAAFPPGAGMEDFLWRLSIARVEQRGPFSTYDGVDRTLAVGEGSLLLSGPVFNVELNAGGEHFAFDGAIPLVGTPLGGAVVNVNAMVRRGWFACAMERLSAGDTACAAEGGFLVGLEPQMLLGEALAPFDCVRFRGSIVARGESLVVHFATDAERLPR
ncbi:MAG: hypothetical protein DI530_08380 [Sphingomonas sp.]|nr:MAG: hypothetical protein DI530_08380 [Sphingomonas sp.]